MNRFSTDSNDSPFDSAQHAPVRRIARNGAVTLLASGVQTLLTVFVLGLMARALEKTELGLYFTVLVVAVVLQLVLEAGVGSIITLRISQAPEQWRRIGAEATGILLLVLVGSVALPLLVGYGWSLWAGQTLPLTLAVAIAATCSGMQIQQFSFGVFRGFERFEFEGLSKIVQSGSLLALTWFLVWGGNATVGVAVGCLAVSYLAGAFFCLATIVIKWPMGRPSFGIEVLKDWYATSVPLGVGIILRRFTLQIDHLLLAMMQPPAMLGIYNVALRPLGPLTLLPQALAAASFPFMARSAVGNEQSHKKAFTASVRFLVIAAVPVVAMMWLWAKPIVLLLAGENYLDAVAPLRVLATILVFSFPTALFRYALTAVNKQAIFTRLVAATLVLQIVLEAILIYAVGYMGACYGFLIGEAFYFGLGMIVCQQLGLLGAWWPGVVRAVPAAALLLLALWACQSATLAQQFLAVGIGTLAYLGMCILFGAIRIEEVRNLLKAFARRGRRSALRTNAETSSSSSLSSTASVSRQLQ